MSGGGGGEKTEKPTAKKLREARKEGRIARSPDVGSWAGMMAATWLVPLTADRAVAAFRKVFAQVPAVIAEPDAQVALRLMRNGVLAACLAVLPLVLTLMAVGIASSIAQGGLHPAWKKVKPQASRMHPGKGLKRLAGPQGLLLAGKAIGKLGVLGAVAWFVGHGMVASLLAPGRHPLGPSVALAAADALHLLRAVAGAGLVLAVLDYAIERRRHNKSLRMTKQEIKEEYRQADGDPHMKGAIRSKQLAVSRNRMIADVAHADVVLVNPTHVAVALAYTPGSGAPRVVAKGAGVVAARIREEAERQRVPMVEDIPLARGLFKACELGTEIPADLYDAVARVLAFVFALRRHGTPTHGRPLVLAGTR